MLGFTVFVTIKIFIKMFMSQDIISQEARFIGYENHTKNDTQN